MPSLIIHLWKSEGDKKKKRGYWNFPGFCHRAYWLIETVNISKLFSSLLDKLVRIKMKDDLHRGKVRSKLINNKIPSPTLYYYYYYIFILPF